MMAEPAEQFREAIRQRLGVDPGAILLDGKVKRFATKANGRDEAGWAVGYADGIPAGSFGDWRSGLNETWCARDVRTLTPVEREQHRRRLADASHIREEERQRVQREAAAKAARIWREAEPASTDHPYLKAKSVGPFGVRQYGGSLVVPIRNGGELESLQFIGPDGGKRFLTGGAVAGGYFSIGKPDGVVIVCEGFATGATLHAVTGHAVAVAFNAGNLDAVANAIRGKFPDARIIIAADDDHLTDGNPGLAKAKSAALNVGGVVAIPPFNRQIGEAGTDWNDFHQLRGEDGTRQAFAAAIAPPSSNTGEDVASPASGDHAPADAAAEIARLATLDAIGYDRERKDAAKRLCIRDATLDAEVKKAREDSAVALMAGMFPVIEPWAEAIDGATLLDDIRNAISRFIICQPETKVAATLWIAFSWFIEAVQVAPLAVITAPEKRCGKTQLLDLIGRLSMRPLVASNISSAAVFRVIEAHRPTLLIDEADAFMKENEELRGVINSGHTRTSAYVIRTVGDDHEPRQFSTWGAKALSGIGSLPETIMDRAVILELRRKLPSESVGRLRHAPSDLFPALARKLARFAHDNEHSIRAARPALPEALNDRAQDNWEPLLAVADLAGGHWPEMARKAALTISGAESEAVSTGAELLTDIKSAFDQDNSLRLSIAMLIDRLTADDMGPWATWNRGKPISPRQLGRRLMEYDIAARTIRFGSGTSKGFERSQFDDAWARYLAAPESPPSVGNSVTSEQNQGLTCYRSSVTLPNENPLVTDKSLKSLGCYSVTDGNPPSGEEAWEATI
jgi:putative DNA primase/helicase